MKSLKFAACGLVLLVLSGCIAARSDDFKVRIFEFCGDYEVFLKDGLADSTKPTSEETKKERPVYNLGIEIENLKASKISFECFPSSKWHVKVYSGGNWTEQTLKNPSSVIDGIPLVLGLFPKKSCYDILGIDRDVFCKAERIVVEYRSGDVCIRSNILELTKPEASCNMLENYEPQLPGVIECSIDVPLLYDLQNRRRVSPPYGFMVHREYPGKERREGLSQQPMRRSADFMFIIKNKTAASAFLDLKDISFKAICKDSDGYWMEQELEFPLSDVLPGTPERIYLRPGECKGVFGVLPRDDCIYLSVFRKTSNLVEDMRYMDYTLRPVLGKRFFLCLPNQHSLEFTNPKEVEIKMHF